MSSRLVRSGLAVAMVAGVGAVAVGPVSAAAVAQDSVTARRTVDGTVRDKNNGLLKGAVVYLKDSRTLAVKSFLADDSGSFHFGQLSSNADYELYAEFEGKRSKTKTISSFDSKTALNFSLVIDTAK